MRWKVVMALMVFSVPGMAGGQKVWANCCVATNGRDERGEGYFNIPCPDPEDGRCEGYFKNRKTLNPTCLVTFLGCSDREEVERECAALGVAGPCGPVRVGNFTSFEFWGTCNCPEYVYNYIDGLVNFERCYCCLWCSGASSWDGGIFSLKMEIKDGQSFLCGI